MNTKLAQALLALILSTEFCSNGYADGLTLDNFSHAQSVLDKGNTLGATTSTVTGLTGTDLHNVTRTFSAEATAGGSSYRTAITSGNYSSSTESYLLGISSTGSSAGKASVIWNFDPIDLTTYGNAILLDVHSIDLDVSVEMVANDIASSGVRTFSSADDYLVLFNDFSNAGVFSNLSSFRLNFTGPLGWDGQFKLLATTTPVPVPATIWLMGSVLLGFIGVSRKKQNI